jgi:2-isopropylmalate synthase
MQKITILDTTLRDGEQTPGVQFDRGAKIEIAKRLEALGVDVIEAGFAASSTRERDAIYGVASEVSRSVVCGFWRVHLTDVLACARAIAPAAKRRIHTFIATSDIHMEHKLKMSKSEVIKRAVDGVMYAKTFVNDVQFSAEDATRSDIGFLSEVIDAVIDAGATTVNIPDSVGFCDPYEMRELSQKMAKIVKNRAILAVHTHNDIGLATACAIESVLGGARQIECAINGLGERAGNAALEEVVMAMALKERFVGYTTSIKREMLNEVSANIAHHAQITPQPNKAIVGRNAFRHESGIHQDGVLKNRSTYEIMPPEMVGWQGESIVLGKHSGRHAIKVKLEALDMVMDAQKMEQFLALFKEESAFYTTISDNELMKIAQKVLT